MAPVPCCECQPLIAATCSFLWDKRAEAGAMQNDGRPHTHTHRRRKRLCETFLRAERMNLTRTKMYQEMMCTFTCSSRLLITIFSAQPWRFYSPSACTPDLLLLVSDRLCSNNSLLTYFWPGTAVNMNPTYHHLFNWYGGSCKTVLHTACKEQHSSHSSSTAVAFSCYWCEDERKARATAFLMLGSIPVYSLCCYLRSCLPLLAGS